MSRANRFSDQLDSVGCRLVDQRHRFNVVARFGAALFEIKYFSDSSDEDKRDNERNIFQIAQLEGWIFLNA